MTLASPAPVTLGIWTTRVWHRESMVMRAGERLLVRLVQRWLVRESEAKAQRRLAVDFVRSPPTLEVVRRKSWFAWPKRIFG
jgi:hypothetical protein